MIESMLMRIPAACVRLALSLLLVGLPGPLAFLRAQTPQRLLEDCTSALSSSGTLAADFISDGTAGTIILEEDRFYLEAGGIQTWFDGKTQWSYLSSSDEVNILTPSPSQLESINPYTYLSLSRRGYRPRAASASSASLRAVLLEAPDRERDPRSLLVEMEASSHLPRILVLEMRNAPEPLKIEITAYRKLERKGPAFFRFDYRAHPDAEVIDLR